MSVFLGFDAGGTKTDCVLLDDAGRLLAEASGGPANPLRNGFAKSCAVLGETAQHVLAESHKDAGDVRSICAGIAGAGRPRVARRVASYLARAFPQSATQIMTDLDIALEAAIGAGQGIVIVAGTGSASCGRNSAGKTARAGGWGPWVGDDGSAYDVGRRGAEASLRSRDGLGPATSLGERILLAAECHDWDMLIERIAKHADDVFPKLFPVVAEAAEAGDVVARKIILNAAEALAQLGKSVIERLGLAKEEIVIGKSGGVFGHSALLEHALDKELGHAAPAGKIRPLEVSPARIAAELARKGFAAAAAHGV